ncbi:MAG TPA: TIGR04076 family protein [Chloroflexi bacterium]|nr:TIGR04076 family protein [Chloroflexota bacterium]
MYALTVTVSKILGTCTADPPMDVGEHFTVRNGVLRMPAGGSICMWALQNLMPVLPLKERRIEEAWDEDWVWRVHHVQCPDPDGRVIYEIERTGELGKEAEPQPEGAPQAREAERAPASAPTSEPGGGAIRNLRVVVEEVRGKCTSGMQPGDYFTLRRGRLSIPAGRHFCLYALQAVLPLLPAKQRPLPEGDWLKDASCVICPDPAGNVVMRIETLG